MAAALRVRVPANTLYSGDDVNGTVIYTPNVATQVQRCAVRLVGWEGYPGSTLRDVTDQRDGVAVLVDETVDVFVFLGSDAKDVPAQENMWPFTLALPPSLPPSYCAESGGVIMYCIQAIVEPVTGGPLQSEAEIMVATVLPNTHTGPSAEAKIEGLVLAAWLDGPVAYPGGTLRVNVEVQNSGNREVSEAHLSLDNSFIFHVKGHTETRREFQVANSFNHGFPLAPRSGLFRSTLMLPIPRDAPCSRTGTTIVCNEWELTVTCRIKGLVGGSKLCVVLPVVMSCMPREGAPLLHPSPTRNEPSFLTASTTTQFATEGIVRQGYLTKQGKVHKNWLKRWFVLDTQHLRYFKSKEASSNPKGDIAISELVRIRRVSERQFEAETEDRTYRLCGESEEDVTEWVTALQELKSRCKQ